MEIGSLDHLKQHFPACFSLPALIEKAFLQLSSGTPDRSINQSMQNVPSVRKFESL